MSFGTSGVEETGGEAPATFEDELTSGERVRFAWTATSVRWADQWGIDSETPTAFAATDRRIIFETDDAATSNSATASATTSIAYDRVRAVKIDGPSDGPDLSTAFLGCGGLCLLVGLLVATRDFANGAGLVLLSVAMLLAGAAVGEDSGLATVTIIIGNERQRLSFSAAESVGVKLEELVDGH